MIGPLRGMALTYWSVNRNVIHFLQFIILRDTQKTISDMTRIIWTSEI